MNCLYKILLFSSVITTFNANGQFTKIASCKSVDFDRKVQSYLSFSAPVISVSDANIHKEKYLFLDAREIEEYNISHLPEARYIGYDDFDEKTISDIPKETKIIVYCSIGYRSEKIATKLRRKGYKNVYNLYGSIFEWTNMGLPLSDKMAKPQIEYTLIIKSGVNG